MRLGIVPALVLAGVVMGIGPTTRTAEGAEARAVTERVFPLKPGGELVIESQNGRITVEAWNRPEARVQITRIVRANDEKRAQEILKDVQADVSVSPEHIGIKSRYPKRTETVGIWDVLGQRVTSMNIHYYVQVPIDTDLTLETSNGDLQVKGDLGRHRRADGERRHRSAVGLGTGRGEHDQREHPARERERRDARRDDER
jgi:hypothetical protein